jgi:hypothetical protein
MDQNHPEFDSDALSHPADFDDGWIDELLDDVLNHRVEAVLSTDDDLEGDADAPLAGYLSRADQRLAAMDPDDDLPEEADDLFEELFLGDDAVGLWDHDEDLDLCWSGGLDDDLDD